MNDFHLNGAGDNPAFTLQGQSLAEAEFERQRQVHASGSPVMDEEDALRSEYEEKIHTLYQLFAKTFEVLVAYQDHQVDPRMQRMSTRAMALCWRFRVAAGADGSAELARKCGIPDKQTVEKCLNLFLKEKLCFPPLPGQRDAQARAHMTAARHKNKRVKG